MPVWRNLLNLLFRPLYWAVYNREYRHGATRVPSGHQHPRVGLEYRQLSPLLKSRQGNRIQIDYQVSSVAQGVLASDLRVSIWGAKLSDHTSGEVVIVNWYHRQPDMQDVPFAVKCVTISGIFWDMQRGCVAGYFPFAYAINGVQDNAPIYCHPQVAFMLDGEWQDDPLQPIDAPDHVRHNFNIEWLPPHAGALTASTPESVENAFVVDTSGSLIDATGVKWTLANKAADGTYSVARNGVVDRTTSKVVQLLYHNHTVYQHSNIAPAATADTASAGGSWYAWQNGAWVTVTSPIVPLFQMMIKGTTWHSVTQQLKQLAAGAS